MKRAVRLRTAAILVLSWTAARGSETAPVITAVVNGASFAPGIASSTWISVYGTNLAGTTRSWAAGDFVDGALPAVLDGVSVRVNGAAAYVYYVSPTQLNVLAPEDGALGNVLVQVANAYGNSNAFAAAKSEFAPALFQFTGRYAAAVHASGMNVALATPAAPGETIMLFGTGFGATDPPLVPGRIVGRAAPLASAVTVTVAGRTATVTYAGVTAAGLDQINVTVPSDVPDGDAAVIAAVAGIATQADLYIRVQRPWRIIGPGGGGSMFEPVISPHDPKVALLHCDMTGAYITKDGGASWREFNLRTTIGAFAFDPVRPDVIYAGSDGVFRSDDRGQTWALVFPDPKTTVERMVGDHAEHHFESTDPLWPGDGTSVQSIRVDQANPDHVYVVIAQAGAPRLYYSFDRGGTWRGSAAFSSQTVLGLLIDQASEVDNRRLVVVSDQGVYTVQIADGSTRALGTPAQPVRDVAGAVDPATGALLLFATTGRGVFASPDGGATWRELRSLANFAPSYTRITVAERNPRILYIGADPDNATGGEYGILKSTDGGDSWVWVHHVEGWRDPANKSLGWIDRDLPGWGGPPIFGVSTDATGEACYATNMGTAYRTLDGGATWAAVYSNEHPDGTSNSRGLDVTTSYGVHFDPFDANHLVVSYTDIGPQHSTNGGATWKRIAQGVPRAWVNTAYWIAFDPDVRRRAWSVWSGAHDLPRPKMFKTSLGQYYNGGVCRTDNADMRWESCSADLGATTHIVVDPHSPAANRTLYATSFGNSGLAQPAKPGGVFKSIDGGATWTLKTTGMTGMNRNAWRLVQLPDGTLYVLIARGLRPGTTTVVDGTIYKSVDGAEHWSAVPLPAGANAPNDLAFDPANPRRMYLACWPRNAAGANENGGLFVTEDGGATWALVFDRSPHVYGVGVDPANPAVVFINTFEGAAFRSDDRGVTWKRLGGYNFKWGHRPVPDPVNPGMLYLTTFGSSVWHGPANGVDGAFEDVYPF